MAAANGIDPGSCIARRPFRAHDMEFYTRFGFSPLEIREGEIESRPKPTPLFLPLEVIAAALVP